MVQNDKYVWCHAYLLSKNIPLTHGYYGVKVCRGSKFARGQIALDCSLNWWLGTIDTCDVMPTYFQIPSKYSLDQGVKLYKGSKLVLAQGQIALDRFLNWWFGTINTCDVMPTYFRMPSKYSLVQGVKLYRGSKQVFAQGQIALVRNDKHLWFHAFLLSNAVKIFPWPIGIMGSKFAGDQRSGSN